MACTHRALVQPFASDPVDYCEDCKKIDGTWVNLRMCMVCVKVGCCDGSPKKHATAHFKEIGHPIMRSQKPGESWMWCYVDEEYVD